MNRRPKVLIVASVVKKHIMQFHIPSLQLLRELGCEVHVAARNDYEHPIRCKIPFCDCYHDIPFERIPWRWQNIRAYRQLRELIRLEDYRLIHCHTPIGGVLARLAADAEGSKVIYTAHGFHFCRGGGWMNHLLYYPVERVLAGVTDYLITINREDFNTAQHFPAGKVLLMPGVGIDTDTYRPQPEKRAGGLPLQVLSVGELTRRKNHALVLRALAQVKELPWRYEICGDGECLPQLRALAEKLEIRERVTFSGYCRDIRERMQQADLFVFPSRREGLPVALMEAMASGLTVLASDVRGNRDLMEGKQRRVMYRPDDAAALAELLHIYLSDSELRREEGNENRRISLRYKQSQVRQQLKSLYEEALA